MGTNGKNEDSWEKIRRYNEENHEGIVQRGYVWYSNILEGESEKDYQKRIGNQEYALRTPAFNYIGEIIPGAKAMFIRKS